MIESWPVSAPTVAALRRLADVSFEVTAFHEECRQIGELDFADKWLANFRSPQGSMLIVGADDADATRVGAAVMSTCWWEGEEQERHEFDDAYQQAYATAVRVAGEPELTGRDRDDWFPHRWALWRGRTGLFVVQQSCYDLQFGVDVNFWVRPWQQERIEPHEPFIDWLMNPPQPGGPSTMD